MALAQPTPIAGTCITTSTGQGMYVTKTITILDVPGPAGSFAVVTLFIPTMPSQYFNLEILVGGRIILTITNNYYQNQFKNEGIIIPGGEQLSVRFKEESRNNDHVLTATGLFYKAS